MRFFAVAVAVAAPSMGSAHLSELHVCCGCDAPSGGVAGTGASALLPLPSLAAAQALIRARAPPSVGPLTVWLSGACTGTNFAFGALDGGASEATRVTYAGRTSPLCVRARGCHEVGALLSPGMPVQRGWFARVVDSAVLAQAPPAARGSLVALDLRAHALPSSGSLPCRTFAAGNAAILPGEMPPAQAELFWCGSAAPLAAAVPLRLAEWPNVGANFSAPLTPPLAWPRTVSVARSANRTAVVDADVAAHVRAAGWATQLRDDPGSAMVHYYSCWFADLHWAIESVVVEGPPGANGSVTLGTCGNMSVGETHMGGGQYFTAYNLLSELDSPGEYTLNVSAQTMYAWLPAGDAGGAPGDIVGALSGAGNAVDVVDASFLTLANVSVMFAQGAGIRMVNSSGVVIDNVTVANVGLMAVNITGGANNIVLRSRLRDAGNGGAYMYSGDRTTLTRGNHSVEDSEIHSVNRYTGMYAPGVAFGGVGNSVRRTEIHNAPHTAVFASGNDHVVDAVAVHHVVQWAGDSGAFYMGRDWTYRGMKIVGSFFHDLLSLVGGAYAIYLDDYSSGVSVLDNTFFNTTCSFLGGGRENQYQGNTYNLTRGCPPIRIDQRCSSAHVPPILLEFLARVPYNTSPAWIAAYPRLPNILADEPCTPMYNDFHGNTFCGTAKSPFASVNASVLASWGSTEYNNTPLWCPPV